jgi:hypothetical protein
VTLFEVRASSLLGTKCTQKLKISLSHTQTHINSRHPEM